MTKLLEIAELRAERLGQLTPKALLENLLENVADIDKIVVAIRLSDGEMRNAYSFMNLTEAIGLFEVGKTLSISDSYMEV